MLWLIYTPLFVAAVTLAVVVALRLSRRGFHAAPRSGDPVHRAVARALDAVPAIDDAGYSWRLHHPDGLRATLPFAWSSVTGKAWTLDPNDTSDLATPLRHFAILLRAPLARVRSRPSSFPVGFGLPLEIISYYFTTESGMPPPDPSGSGIQRPRWGFELREANILAILENWSRFDQDLSLLMDTGCQADLARAFLLAKDRPVWIEQPIWPAGSAPPAPFLIHMIEDEIQLLAVYPGHRPNTALADPAWIADQIRWYAEALPTLTENTLRLQRLGRTPPALSKSTVPS